MWVEGATEERSFPLIVSHYLRDVFTPGITKILGVTDTSPIDNKNANRVINIYRKLSAGSSLIPPAIGFIFDREDKSLDAIKRLKETLGIQFLDRMMYENYLLNPSAIADVISLETIWKGNFNRRAQRRRVIMKLQAMGMATILSII